MKHENENRRKVKSPFLAVLAVVLVCAVAVGGTLAYLSVSQAGDNAVVNTFVAAGGGDIIDPTNPDDDDGDPDPTPTPVNPDDPTDTVELQDGFYLVESESTLNSSSDAYEIVAGADDVLANDYESVVPGMTIAKNPNLTVNIAENVSAYIFVKVTDTTDGNLTYTIDSAWTEVTGVSSLGANEKLYLYTGAAVVGRAADGSDDGVELNSVSILSGDTVTAATNLTDTNLGDLTFEAYICQSAGFTDAAAAYTACFGN